MVVLRIKRYREGYRVFDILATIVGKFDGEADAIAFAQDIERCVTRVRHRGIVVEVRDNRLADTIHKRIVLPAMDPDQD